MSILRTIGRRLWAAYQGFQEHEAMLSASGIAYYVALSFFPLMLVLLAGLGWVLAWTDVGNEAQEQLLAAIKQQASPELADQVARMLRLVSERAGTGGPIGFAGLVVSAIFIFGQLDWSFARIFKTPSDPHEGWLPWVGRLAFQRLKALIMLLGVGAFILAVMVTSMVLSGVREAMDPAVRLGPWTEWAASLSVNLVLNFLAFTMIYRVLPPVYVRWREAVQGGIVAAILWEMGRQALTAYFMRLDYPTAYGIIGSFLVVMLWAFYGSLLLLFGAEYVRASRDDRH